MWGPMHKVVPPGELGVAKVEHAVVTEHDAAFAAIRRERLSPGVLTQLFIHGQLMMSDGDMEKASNSRAAYQAHGDVLVAGLGIGMVLVPMLRNPDVKSVLVVEKWQEVVTLVYPHLCDYLGHELADKLAVTVGDVFTWKPETGQSWDWIYFDIWPDICTDNLPEITKLKRRFAKRVRSGGCGQAGGWGRGRRATCDRASGGSNVSVALGATTRCA